LKASIVNLGKGVGKGRGAGRPKNWERLCALYCA
jgi:hypothetical protein